MSRLQAELRRLYFPTGSAQEQATEGGLVPVQPDGRARALVLEVTGADAWGALSAVWQGVQADLQLPPPCIAVSGRDGLQLWFSLAEAVPVQQAAAFLAALRSRYLANLSSARVRAIPAPAGVTPTSQKVVLPPAQAAAGRWSAFVAADLAALFGDEPWIDLPPGADAQADILSRARSISGAEWTQAMQQWMPASQPAETGSDAPDVASPVAGHEQDPRRFLLQVMQDPAVDLRLRIEAAKALLPYGASLPEDQRGRV